MALLSSGRVTAGDVQAEFVAQSATHSGVTDGQAIILAGLIKLGYNSAVLVNDNTGAVELLQKVSAPAAVAGAQLYANVNGNLSAVRASGLAGQLPAIQVDAPGIPYTTALGPADLTKSWPVPAGDGVTGTTYTIDTHITIETGTAAETFTIGADINGTRIPLATLGAAFNGSAPNTTYDIPVRMRLIVNAAGASTPQITLAAGLGDTSANRLATNSANLAGSSVSATWNPASANTFAVYGVWGAAGGGPQNATAYTSEFRCSGP